MLSTILLALALRYPQAQTLGPFYSDAINVPADMAGTPETRPCCWGYAGAQYVPFVFANVPEGYRVRVVALQGSYMAWARDAYQPGHHAGISWGIVTTAAQGSARLLLVSGGAGAADDCFAYYPYAIGNGEVNQTFSVDTTAGGLLEADNTFVFVSAVFLNDEPISIHQETTFILTFQYEKHP